MRQTMKIFLFMICSAFILQGCLLERAAPLTPIKSERDYWSKSNTSDEVRQMDWLECGGGKAGLWGVDMPPSATDAMYWQASDQKITEIMACMRSKGYQRSAGGEGWLPRNSLLVQ